MPSRAELHEFARTRASILLDEERPYRRKLRVLKCLSWVAVTAGVAFPLVAGSALLARPELFGEGRWALIGGILVLVAAILTGLHKGLKCESYHADCQQRLHALRSLIEGYEGIVLLSDDEVGPAIKALEERLARLREIPFDIPPARRPRPDPRSPGPVPPQNDRA
jgi:hypothetical protein